MAHRSKRWHNPVKPNSCGLQQKRESIIPK